MEGVSGWGLVANGVNLVVSALGTLSHPPSPPQGREEWLEIELSNPSDQGSNQPCLGSETVIKTLKG